MMAIKTSRKRKPVEKSKTAASRESSATHRKSWVQKRDTGKEPVVKTIDRDFADLSRGDRMLIATPAVVDKYIRDIPRGQRSDLTRMRKDLAIQFHADKTCPVTSGIFLRIVAEAAWEEFLSGQPLSHITPFWRMIAPDSATARKLTFGIDWLRKQRKKEGIDEDDRYE